MSDILSRIFESHEARAVEIEKGAALFLSGDRVTTMYHVLVGDLALIRHTVTGDTVTLQKAHPGSILAEASAYSNTYHCDAIALSASRVATLSRDLFLSTLDRDTALSRQWAGQLARQVQSARMRAEIRTLKTVGQRLDVWLGEGHALPRKGNWQDLAGELGVTREALYRELARRRAK